MTETGFHLKHHLTSFQIMILGFAGVILLGALVLMLPVSTAGRVWTPFHEALFTSTSAVCVTGLVVQDTGSYWSAFGQTVILLLIQIGGLGVITAAVTFLMLSGRNISLKERSAMQDAISAPAVGGIVRLTRFVLKGTFLVELVGALALLSAFCRDYGLRGVWLAVFHSVSAFCNAGFDILGRADALYPSLTAYMADPLINIVIMQLSELGHQVMAVDRDEERVNECMPFVTNAQIGDSTRVDFLRSLGVGNYDVCYVTISGDFQNSLETTSLLLCGSFS